MTDPLRAFSTRATPQREPDPLRTDQVRNSAGGFVFESSNWMRLRRFLVLGTDGGTAYISERALTKENATVLMQCIKEDGPRVVRELALVSELGLAPKQNATMFALAACSGSPDPATRRAAEAAIATVCRTGSHILMFASYVEQFRGWGRGLRRAVARWYETKTAENLAYQVVKYQAREGWSQRDLLRLAHPEVLKGSVNDVLAWIAGKEADAPLPDVIRGFEDAKGANDLMVASAIRKFGLPREAVPSEALRSPMVWEALLEDMPITAMTRNLATMTKVGLIKPFADATKYIVDRLTDVDLIKRGRVHPMQFLLAAHTYGSGHGYRGAGEWVPEGKIVDALGEAFTLAFQAVKPTGKRTLLCLDVSGSMNHPTIGSSMSCREAGAAMSLVSLATEPSCAVVGYDTALHGLSMTPKSSLREAIGAARVGGGGTDASQPILWATQEKLNVDTFVFYTDNETWAGRQHPHQALREYKDASGIDSRVAFVSMAANRFTIADPTDATHLDLAGLDGSTPALISEFSLGNL